MPKSDLHKWLMLGLNLMVYFWCTISFPSMSLIELALMLDFPRGSCFSPGRLIKMMSPFSSPMEDFLRMLFLLLNWLLVKIICSGILTWLFYNYYSWTCNYFSSSSWFLIFSSISFGEETRILKASDSYFAYYFTSYSFSYSMT